MRLPWPFGRAQRSPSEGDAASSGASGGGSARPGGGAGAAERAPGDAWRSLPPLTETVGPPPLVAPNRPFAAALAGSEPPAPILAPLSHGQSLEAPRGLVAGVAKPVAASRGPELPKPVQRSPLHSRRGSAADVDPPTDDGPEPAAAVTAPAMPNAAPAVSPMTIAPIRRLDVTAGVPRPAGKELTRAPEPATLAKPLGLVGPARAAMAGVQRAPQPAPAPEPVRPASIPAPMAEPAPLPRPEPDRDRPRLSIGQARRLGLGSPIASGPIAVSAPPFAGSATAPAALAPTFARPSLDATSPGIQRAPETPSPDMPLATHPAATPPDEVAPATIPSVAQVVGPMSPRSPVTARRVGAAPSQMSGPTTPIVSAQPLRARVQRAPLTLPTRAVEASGSGSTVVTPASVAGPAGAPVKVHRDAGAALLSKSLDARSFTHGGDIYLPASHGPLSSGKGRSLLAHELTHVTQQRRLGSSLPEEHTPHGKALEAEAVAAERGADMPLATPPAPPKDKATPPPAGAAADLSTPASIHASGGSPAASTTGPAQRAPSNAGGGEAGNGRRTHSEQELEDLAGQLYARIGRQLRRELLVDRERAGFAMDLG